MWLVLLAALLVSLPALAQQPPPSFEDQLFMIARDHVAREQALKHQLDDALEKCGDRCPAPPRQGPLGMPPEDKKP